MDVLGAGLWAATFTILGYLFWQSFDRAVDLIAQGKLVVGAAVAVGALAVVVVRVRRGRAGRRAVAGDTPAP